MSDLRARCETWIKHHVGTKKPLATTDSLVEFVLAEIGRSKAGGALDASYPAVAYFRTAADRDDFVNVICEANPNIRAKAVL